MIRIHVRDIIGTTTDALWEDLPPTFVLVDDFNEEIATNSRKTIYTSYYWDVIRAYPNIKIKLAHHLDLILAKAPYGTKTHRLLIDSFYRDIVEKYSLWLPIQRDPLNELIYKVNNHAYNELSVKLIAFVTSIDILDFIEVTDISEISEAIKDTPKTKEGIENCYSVTTKALMSNPLLDSNPVAKAARFGTANINQILQCVAARGYNADVDGTIFPTPITNSYLAGMRSLYDSMVESRLAAKSLLFTKAPLEQTEYFARRLQIVTMVLQNMHYVDCGSDKYLDWLVLGESENIGGGGKYGGDLKLMVGKHYLDEESNTLKEITGNEKHLVGKIIKVRSLIAGCNHPDPVGVCSACYGSLAHNIPPGANVGHINAATLNKDASQNVLSTKHSEASASNEALILDSVKSRYFRLNKTKDSYMISKECLSGGVLLEIPRDSITSLKELISAESVSMLDISRVISIDEVGFVKDSDVDSIYISQNGRRAVFTKEFINFLKKKGYTINCRNNFVFNLKGWSYDLPIFYLPSKQSSNFDHVMLVATMIEGTVSNSKKNGRNEGSVLDDFRKLFYTINSRLNVKFSVLEAIFYSYMTKTANGMDMGLPKNDDPKLNAPASSVVKYRSLSAAMAYEHHRKIISSPSSFYKLGRQNHKLDVFLAPKEVMDSKS